MFKAAIYCRLSVEDRNKENSESESESMQNQKALLTKYASEKGWEIYRIYCDEDYSGLDRDRPEFNRMIEAAETGRFDIVLCKSQSRFTRDMELVEKYLHDKFIEWGIRFISLTDNADTAERGNKKSRQINGLVNEWYSEDLSEAIKASFRIKRESGRFIGSFACYGYSKDPSDKNRLIIDDTAAETVRSIFSMYLEGYGTQYIADMLNRKGLPNPAAYKQSAGLKFRGVPDKYTSGLWNRTTVKRILQNEMYIGNMVQGKRKKVSYKSKKVVSTRADDWYVVQNTHQPIIDAETFSKVRKMMKKRKRSGGGGQAHILAAKVICMNCGSTMNKVAAGSGYMYLRCRICAGKADKSLASCSIRLDDLQSIVEEQLKFFIHNLSSEESVARSLFNYHESDKRTSYLLEKAGKLKKQLEEEDKLIKKLYWDKLKDIIQEEQFIEFNRSFISDRERMIKQLDSINGQINSIHAETNTYDGWVDIVNRYRNFAHLTRTMVNELIEYIEISERNKRCNKQLIRIHWKF